MRLYKHYYGWVYYRRVVIIVPFELDKKPRADLICILVAHDNEFHIDHLRKMDIIHKEARLTVTPLIYDIYDGIEDSWLANYDRYPSSIPYYIFIAEYPILHGYQSPDFALLFMDYTRKYRGIYRESRRTMNRLLKSTIITHQYYR